MPSAKRITVHRAKITAVLLMFGFFSRADTIGSRKTNDSPEMRAAVAAISEELSSSDPNIRAQAMDELIFTDSPGFIYNASDDVLAKLVLQGLSDSSPVVRLLACTAAASGSERLVHSAYLKEMEKTLGRLSANVMTNDPGLENSNEIEVEALSALHELKYNHLPLPLYCSWEQQTLLSTIINLAASDSEENLCSAATLCRDVECDGDQAEVIKLLGKLLASKSAKVRLAALDSVSSFAHMAHYRPANLLLCVSLSSQITQIAARDESSKCRESAEADSAEIDRFLTLSQQELKIKLVPNVETSPR